MIYDCWLTIWFWPREWKNIVSFLSFLVSIGGRQWPIQVIIRVIVWPEGRPESKSDKHTKHICFDDFLLMASWKNEKIERSQTFGNGQTVKNKQSKIKNKITAAKNETVVEKSNKPGEKIKTIADNFDSNILQPRSFKLRNFKRWKICWQKVILIICSLLKSFLIWKTWNQFNWRGSAT